MRSFYLRFLAPVRRTGKTDVDKPRVRPSQSVVAAFNEISRLPTERLGTLYERDRVAPWYVCSGSLTLASWNKLGKDLVRKMEDGDLRQGTTAIWKLIKNCLEDRDCQTAVAEGRSVLEEVQDSISETERSERLGALRRNGPRIRKMDLLESLRTRESILRNLDIRKMDLL